MTENIQSDVFTQDIESKTSAKAAAYYGRVWILGCFKKIETND